MVSTTSLYLCNGSLRSSCFLWPTFSPSLFSASCPVVVVFFLLFVFFHDLPYSTLTYTLYMGTCYEVITFPANSWEFERLLKDSPAAGSTEHPNDLQLTGLHRRAGDRSMLGGEVLAQETLLLGDLRSGELGNTNGTLW